MKSTRHTKILNIRIRDKHVKMLNGWVFAVNQVWSYCNELSFCSIRERQTWLAMIYRITQRAQGKNWDWILRQCKWSGMSTRLTASNSIKLGWTGANQAVCAGRWAGYPYGKTVSVSKTAVCIITGNISKFGIVTAWVSTHSDQARSMKMLEVAGISVVVDAELKRMDLQCMWCHARLWY